MIHRIDGMLVSAIVATSIEFFLFWIAIVITGRIPVLAIGP